MITENEWKLGLKAETTKASGTPVYSTPSAAGHGLTVNETKKLLGNLENDIKELITKFSNDTGVSVKWVELDSVQLMGLDSKPVDTIINVRVTAEI
jgi:hypothetical protein